MQAWTGLGFGAGRAGAGAGLATVGFFAGRFFGVGSGVDVAEALVVETAVVAVGALDELCVGAAAVVLEVLLCEDGPVAAPMMTRATKKYETMAPA
jgi:hypothetical protein